ncbi:hypothetical protein VTO42DRAFT_87 [Malbranchea cinnamomea]
MPSKKRSRESSPSSDDDNEGARRANPKRPRHRYNKDGGSRREDKGPSINELKTKIRDAKRLLRRDTIPADVRVEKERAIQAYEQDLQKLQQQKKRSAMIAKYHFVRFLERKKATKALKYLLADKSQLEKEGDATPEQLAELEKRIHIARVDLHYTMYSPLTEKYISLFPNEAKDEKRKDADNDNEAMTSEERKKKMEERKAANKERLKRVSASSENKPPLWYAVEQSMKDGTLDLLREGKLEIGVDGQKKKNNNNSNNKPQHGASSVPKKENKGEGPGLDAGTSKKKEKEKRKTVAEEEGDLKKKKKKKKNDGSKSAARSKVQGSEDESDEGGFFEI